jgi:hypothetical protein
MGGEGTVITPSPEAVKTYDTIYQEFVERFANEQV